MADIDVIPGILEKDWSACMHKVSLVAPCSGWVHVSLSDGTMGTEETLIDFSGFPAVSTQYPDVQWEVHVLSASPEKYVRTLADVGVKRVIAHVECNDPRRFLDEAKFDEIEIGMAIDGATEIDQVEPFLEEVDFVVIASAEAGKSGGIFLPEAVEKIKLIRQNYPDLPIEAVGGITDITVKAVKDAGATRIVASDFIFNHPDGVAVAIEALRSL